jgi:hypothetical protein
MKLVSRFLIVLSVAIAFSAVASGDAVAQAFHCDEWRAADFLISLDACSYTGGGSGFYRFHNGHTQPVRINFSMEFVRGNPIQGSTNVPANGTSGNASCFNCGYMNGGLHSWTLQRTLFPGNPGYF